MSHLLTIPIDEHGLIRDRRFEERLQTATPDAAGITDVFLYSPGWCNPGTSAQADQSVFSLGFAKALQGLVCASPAQWPRIGAAFAPLALPVHWPSRLAEAQDPAQRADSVGRHAGYSILRLMIERQTDRQPCRFNLIGHSFGCRVLCSALQMLAQDAGMPARLACTEFNVALLQPAADADSLAPGRQYGRVQSNIPKLRMLVTTSARDTALSKWHPEAMGAKGPTGDLIVPVDQRFDVTNEIIPTFTQRLGVANLTPLHEAAANDRDRADDSNGQHSHINLPQVYDLLARFFCQ